MESPGFLSKDYCATFATDNELIHLEQSGGFLYQRPIDGTKWQDLSSVYPFFCCHHWNRLPQDLDRLKQFASVSLVADPFGEYSMAALKQDFDVVNPFKDRYVIELSSPPSTYVSRHHRKEARKALRAIEVSLEPQPALLREAWQGLYSQTLQKNQSTSDYPITPKAAIEHLSAPGMLAFVAKKNDRIVAMHLWSLQGRYAYGYLAGHSPEAYLLRAPYGLLWTAVEWFADHADCLDLGGMPSYINARSSAEKERILQGHAFYKKGWASHIIPTYFLGKVLNPDIYRTLVERDSRNNPYFPAYRAIEI